MAVSQRRGGLGAPFGPDPVRPTPWAFDGVPGEGLIPVPLPPPDCPTRRFLRAISVAKGPIFIAISNLSSGLLTSRIALLFSERPISLRTSGLRQFSTVLE